LKEKVFIFIFCVALGTIGLHRAAAQFGPPPPPVVSSPGAVPSGNVATPGTTTVVRIFTGSGYFDNALAAEIRPALAKAYPFSIPEPGKAVATSAAPANSDSQKKIAETANR
jgi:hypothetical protein